MSITLTSPAFAPGERMPVRHTADGANSSPPLQWTKVPSGTAELALICDDPDAPRPDPWVHWVVYRITPSVTGLPEGLPAREQLSEPMGARQGRNDFRQYGYGGPAPPSKHGTHHYHFRLYALDAKLELAPGATKGQLLEAMSGHVLAHGELVGTYSR
jgi:Raf kinase inhibitor-like YbhB/YbcL family protein